MKRSVICLVLILCVAFSACSMGETPEITASPSSSPDATEVASVPTPAPTIPEPTVSEPPSYEDEELARAVALSIGAYSDENGVVTYAQFFDMLDRVVELADPTKLPEWRAKLPEARQANRPIKRVNAMICVFCAAETLGSDFYCMNAGWSELSFAHEPWNTNEWTPDELFGDLMRIPSGFDGKDEPGGNYGGTAFFYSTSRISIFSGKPLFEFDKRQGSARTTEALRYDEALLAALRLHDSSYNAFPISERLMTEDDYEIIRQAEARKQAIMNSPTTVVVTGTKYYVANNGNDKNNGRSPETPWKTLEKVNRANLKSGDGVFFNRGDLWRNAYISAQEGVTYSAYGTGAKPLFYGSPENGTGAEKWELLSGTENIWVYYNKLTECGSIIINGGETCATKIMPYLDGMAYVMPDGSGEKFDVIRALTDDLSFYSDDDTFISRNAQRYDLPGKNNTDHWDLTAKRPGKLYFRCDEGNPGEVFDDIEFLTWGEKGWAFVGAKDVVFDNLALKYTGGHGISGLCSNYIVQNCEIGYVGGTIHRYVGGQPFRYGAGAQIIDMNVTRFDVRDNYIYQCYDEGITNQFENDDNVFTVKNDNITYSGNLIERCSFGIHIFLATEDARDKYTNVSIADNMIMHTGYGWIRSDNGSKSAVVLWGGFGTENFSVKNNVLYIAFDSLIDCRLKKEYQPMLDHNTYTQNNNGILAVWAVDEGTTLVISADRLKDVVNDKTGKIMPPSYQSVD